MKLDQMYPSKYLKSEDIEGSTPTVSIAGVTMEEMVDGKKKPVITFIGKDKAMVLNVTNASVIGAHYGDDTDKWNGRPIQLRVEPVQGPNGMTKGLRVSVPQQAAPQAQPVIEAAGPDVGDSFDDDIPF